MHERRLRVVQTSVDLGEVVVDLGECRPLGLTPLAVGLDGVQVDDSSCHVQSSLRAPVLTARGSDLGVSRPVAAHQIGIERRQARTEIKLKRESIGTKEQRDSHSA